MNSGSIDVVGTLAVEAGLKRARSSRSERALAYCGSSGGTPLSSGSTSGYGHRAVEDTHAAVTQPSVKTREK